MEISHPMDLTCLMEVMCTTSHGNTTHGKKYFTNEFSKLHAKNCMVPCVDMGVKMEWYCKCKLEANHRNVYNKLMFSIATK